jgi:CBS domain-containing protein
MKISDLIGKREVLTVRPDENLEIAERAMIRGSVRHLPVVEGRRVVGVISERDILRRQAAHGRTRADRDSVHESMTPTPVTIGTDADATDARRIMIDCHVSCLPVLDGHHELVGILTRTDLLRAELPPGDEPALPPDTARMLMQRVPVTAAADDQLLDALAKMQYRCIRHLPIVDGDRRVVGMLSDRDVRTVVGDLAAEGDEQKADIRLRSLRVSDVMTREPLVLRPDAPFSQVVHAFIDQKVGAVPVVGEDDRLMGIISYIDILRNAGAL